MPGSEKPLDLEAIKARRRPFPLAGGRRTQAESDIDALVAEVERLRAGLETIRDTFNSDTASVVNGTIRVHVHTHVERILR